MKLHTHGQTINNICVPMSRPTPLTERVGKPGRFEQNALKETSLSSSRYSRAPLRVSAERADRGSENFCRPIERCTPFVCGECAGCTGRVRACVGYEAALCHARSLRYSDARNEFKELLKTYPHFEKAWISYAQMEKRQSRAECRSILRDGLYENPRSASLLQAWGLLELQEGNNLAAYGLLHSSAKFDPRNAKVLAWKSVSEIGQAWRQRQASLKRRRQHRHVTRMQTAAERER
ncbi:hypothetical protein CYMTET_9784 [Cymbomonas tetramitiformis]|uniref:Uncharacterized protein n=1 Tax=Cymbomonas tetramitiformis TaxID=36881 RepID=A0AAE0GQT9_9CHLO|nr:hypothetical protein CYMTET_9784 [Cymbomonas tetramitiformis]